MSCVWGLKREGGKVMEGQVMIDAIALLLLSTRETSNFGR